MRKVFVIVFSFIVVLPSIYFWPNIRGAFFALKPPPADITEKIPETGKELLPGTNSTDMPLKLPPGFDISIFAKNIPGARDMAFGPDGALWFSQTSEGKIIRIAMQDGRAGEQKVVYSGLRRPHGIAFDYREPQVLYIASAGELLRVDTAKAQAPTRVIELPSGGNHNYYSLRFGPDGRLYVSMGSTCNVCLEQDQRRAAIYSLNPDGSDFKEFARGLRNAPFFTWSYVDGRMWATEMGRDLLGDDLPPDEINIIEEDKNYGWPICYGKNIHDTDFDKNTYIRNPCMEPFEIPSRVDLPAHSAPLGLGFIPEEGWPEEYWYDLLVAYHGSWNRTTPTGYKVVRVKLDAQGNFEGIEDFISGWLTPDGALGRPVGILIQPGGTMYISDDHAGVIYKVARAFLTE
ncbi:MAG: PQQ-dependent sugar dehydrogenase [Patescibacteria group bacterium]